MCGIFAYFSLNGENVPQTLGQGVDFLRHRGPDRQGAIEDSTFFLGHCRLKIIDLSDEANQPFCSDDGRYGLLFNGEIYNYREERRLLERQGHTFRTQSDTEVLLRLYQVDGLQCLKRLNGMFAFVIYDRKEKKVVAARDRFGIKPLYYAFSGRSLCFASELGSLLESGVVARQVDPEALGEYLHFGAVQSPRTIIQGIRSLNPGELLIAQDGQVKIERYWELPFIPEAEKARPSSVQAVARIRELLTESVKRQLVSDVPLGVFLSGGIDSSTVVGAMATLGIPEIKTFSIGYDVGGNETNETVYARVVARRHRTEHHEFTLTGEDVARELPRYIRHLDQPSSDGLNTYFVSKFARERVTVVLSGLGGDEVFAGYNTVRWLQALDRLEHFFPKVPRFVGHAVRENFERMPYVLQRNHLVRGTACALSAWPTALERYVMIKSFYNNREQRLILGHENGQAATLNYEELARAQALSPVDAATFLDFSVYMRNTLLRDVDVMSMAHSLELRVPFLDHPLIEYVTQLPSAMKIDERQPKVLLTEAFADLLPPEVIYRKKMGFCFPIGLWLQRPPLRNVMMDCLSPDGLPRRDLFERNGLRRVIASDLKRAERFGGLHLYRRLWHLTTLELWLREVIDR